MHVSGTSQFRAASKDCYKKVYHIIIYYFQILQAISPPPLLPKQKGVC